MQPRNSDLPVLPPLVLPSDEDLHAGALARWAQQSHVSIDAWPQAIAELSMPTHLVEVDPGEIFRIYDVEDPDGGRIMLELSARLDAIMGFREHFIRLNTRSPKDAAHPGLPITCAGKQAMLWISNSMRCMDDISMLKYARKPCYIALRERVSIRTDFEMRCFARDGHMIAASRYNYRDAAHAMWESFGEGAFETAGRFYQDHLAEHYKDVVFDLAIGTGRSERPLLIELNPYGLSDPCLFGNYQAIEGIGGLRY